MAFALSIVAEAGIEGFYYASAANSITTNFLYQSNKRRWMLSASPSFSPKEFRYFMAYAAKESMVEAGDATGRLAVGQLDANTWTLTLTMKGYEFVQDNDKPLLERWAQNVRDNAPTVILSILAALASSWVIFQWGAPK